MATNELWQLQLDFTNKFWATKGGLPQGEAALTAATKDYAIHLIKEVTEVLDEISFRMHRPNKEFIDRHNIMEELIDVNKFLFGLMQIWGFSYEEYEEEFKRKSMVVEQRFSQDHILPQLRNNPCVIVDIDGVLTNYPACFFNWLKARSDSVGYQLSMYEVRQNYEGLPLEEKEAVKRTYRQSGAKRSLPLLPGASDLLQLLRASSQLKIVLLTNRPYAEHYRIFPDTLAWLEENKLPYDAILWTRDKGLEAAKNFKNICWAVDDSPANIARLKEAGIPAIQLYPERAGQDTTAFVEFLSSMSKIEDAGYEYEKRGRSFR